MVSGARDDRRVRRHAREVLQHDGDLRVGVDGRRDVEVVAGEHDGIEVARGRAHPVELLQRLVQVGHEQQPHVGWIVDADAKDRSVRCSRQLHVAHAPVRDQQDDDRHNCQTDDSCAALRDAIAHHVARRVVEQTQEDGARLPGR